MGFKQMDSKGYGGYAKIWSIENKGKYSLANISTSKKVKDEDRYETDFQDGYVRLIGSAHDKAQELNVPKSGISIQIKSCDVQNSYNPNNKTKYTTYIIYAFDVCDGKKTNKMKDEKSEIDSAVAERAVVNEQEDLPF